MNMNTDNRVNAPAGCSNCITLTQTFHNAIEELRRELRNVVEKQAEELRNVVVKQAEDSKRHESAIIPLVRMNQLS
jgi:predicted metal-dependent hydrolase